VLSARWKEKTSSYWTVKLNGRRNGCRKMEEASGIWFHGPPRYVRRQRKSESIGRSMLIISQADGGVEFCSVRYEFLAPDEARRGFSCRSVWRCAALKDS